MNVKLKSRFLLKNQRIIYSLAILIGIFCNPVIHAENNSNGYLSINQTNRTVKGNVIDETGEPLIGVSISVVGASAGVITDIEGRYSITMPANTTQLRFNYIGYKEQIITVGTQTEINVILHEDNQLLDEVVVVGYGTQKKASLTGAVTAIDSHVFEEKGGLSSPLEALQGQVPGVIITRSSAAPGDESWNMSLRGASSINTTEPLIVIDGVASYSVNELRLLNSNDIASINFLKDGAAAIYGSRAAGGVVLITTKKGVSGKTKVEYSGTATYKTIGLMPEVMSIDQWADGVMTALNNDENTSNVWYTYAQLAKKYKGSYLDLSVTQNPFGNAAFTDVSDFVFDDNVNWLNSLFGDSWSNEQNLSISGGTDRSSYRVSLSYLRDNSNLQFGNNKNERYNFRTNNTYNLSKDFVLESSVSYNRQEQVVPTRIGSVISVTMPMPGLPLKAMDGKNYAWGTWGSPVAQLEDGGDNKLSVSAISINETLKYNINDWLNATIDAGYNTSTATRNTVENSISFYNYKGDKQILVNPTQANSSYRQTSSRTDFYSFSGYANAHQTFANKHDFSLTLGMQYEFREHTFFGAKVKDIQEGLEIINGAGEITLSGDENKYQVANLSYFGRFNYAYDNRYLFEINGRYDGSSKFQPENRWDLFYGVSLGWRIQQEAFLRDVNWLHDLKLRLSYAEMGNQSGISNYDGVQLYNMESGTGPYIGSEKLSYIKTSGVLASNSRSWERVNNYNLGLDFGFLGGSLSGSIDAFMKRNNNMLVSITFPGTLGDSAPRANAGKFKTWGLEGQLNYRGKINAVNYHIGGTFTFARDKITDFGGTTVLKSGYVREQQFYPLRSIFGLRYGGKIQNKEQLNAYKTKYYDNNQIGMPSNLRIGDNMYVDENGDGVLDENDYIHLGSDTPEISYSFNLGAEYKGFDINFIFQGAANRFVYRGIDNWSVPFRANHTNTTTASIGKTWSENKPNAYYAPYTNDGNLNNYNYQASTLTAQDGRYLRLKNITIGYTLPRNILLKTKFIEGARIYITGTDLWETTKIKDGWDPEASAYDFGNNRAIGGGVGRYPFTRNFTFGVNLTF